MYTGVIEEIRIMAECYSNCNQATQLNRRCHSLLIKEHCSAKRLAAWLERRPRLKVMGSNTRAMRLFLNFSLWNWFMSKNEPSAFCCECCRCFAGLNITFLQCREELPFEARRSCHLADSRKTSRAHLLTPANTQSKLRCLIDSVMLAFERKTW